MSAYPHSGPSELDYLVNTLRTPDSSVTVQNILSYLYNYMPYVKHEHNLKVVLASFLNNPVCFGKTVPSFHDNYLIIEVFKLITEKKLKVSQPTLPIKIFYNVIEKELRNFVSFNPLENSWKVLPIIAGISLSSELRGHLLPSFLEYRWFFSDFDTSMHKLFIHSFQNTISASAHSDVTNLALVSLALKYRSSENLHEYLGQVDPKLVIRMLVRLLYGQNGGAGVYKLFASEDSEPSRVLAQNIFQHPVTKHINRISFLLEHLFQGLNHTQESYSLVLESVALLLDFNTEFAQFTELQSGLNRETDTSSDSDAYEQNFWRLAKGILFSQVVIFQGIISRFLSSRNMRPIFQIFSSKSRISRLEIEYREICFVILNSLAHLNFILMAVGQGGFDGYNFIYYVSLELVLQNNGPRTFESFTKILMGGYEFNLRPQALNSNYVARCKVLFILGMWENYLQQASVKDEVFVQYLYEITFKIAENQYLEDASLVEAAHSVLLSYFSGMANTQENLQKVLNYIEILVGQFPARLSAHQLSVAVETLGKKIMTHAIVYENGMFQNSIDEFLYFVYFKCFNAVPGQPIKNAKAVLFNSAQPIAEIEASSTLSQLENNSESINIIKENKGEKPKDMAIIDGLFSPENNAMDYFAIRETPNTSREAIIMAFLNVIPYLPMSVFVNWLNKIWSLIMGSNKAEQTFLIDRMWKGISENLDLNRAEVAYQWWYETLRAPEFNIGHQPTLFKL